MRSLPAPVFRPSIALSGGLVVAATLLALAPDTPPPTEVPQDWTLLAWNDLGMHCVDEDFSIFAILPPFNTLNAQLMDPAGNPVGGGTGITLHYEGSVDLDGSSTHTAARSNFWEHAEALFGVALAPGEGLAGSSLPGEANHRQPMHWVAAQRWWEATGIPVLPVDESGLRQSYPLFRLTARDAQGVLLAETYVTAPVSAEMNCRTCHSSTAGPAAQPIGGWVGEADPVRDYRLNILRLHDERQAGDPTYTAALAALGYDPGGLFPTVVEQAHPILCASCHASAALGADGVAGIPAMTQAMHGGHAGVLDPDSGILMNASDNRASCYQCHPGKQTQCLRGAMGSAVNASGEKAISCQSCHGGMDTMAASDRFGWFDEPNCQSCHTGTATDNSGEIRYLDALVAGDALREPANPVFATKSDVPAAGFSLYRFSHGHGDLSCSACHGSPHAILPTTKRNDNLQALDQQGHAGTIGDCRVCHQNGVQTADRGPHGMHTIGPWWIQEHGEGIEDDADSRAACQACHGSDDRGTVLSKALGPRNFDLGERGSISFWEGQTIGCYDCHRGPDSDDRNRNARPVAQDQIVATAVGVTVVATLGATDAENAPIVRLVSPPSHGRLAMEGTTVSYTPDDGFTGTDVMCFAAFDGEKESNLATVRFEVGDAPFSVDLDADGRSDILERVFGTQRNRPGTQANPLQILVREADGTRRLRFICDLRFAPPDLRVFLESSADLSDWDEGGAAIQRSQDHRGRTLFEVTLPPASTPLFLRFGAESTL